MLDYEIKKATIYTCDYKDYKGKNWDAAFLKLVNNNATYSHLFKRLEMRQGSRDDDGFYPNYIYIVVDNSDCNFNVDEMLDAYGFAFKKRSATIKCYFVDYDENIDDYFIDC